MPATGSADPNVNPMYKLLLDAQFTFLQSAKGSNEDPSVNYYPAKAMPVDWYNEASAAWKPFSLGQPQIKPADPSSQFVKLGGLQLVNQGAIRVAPAAQTTTVLQQNLTTALSAKTSVSLAMAKTPMKPMMAAPVAAMSFAAPVAMAAPPIRSQVVSQSGGSLADASKVKTALLSLNAQQQFKTSIQAPPVTATVKVAPNLIDAKTLTVSRAAGTVDQRVVLDRLLVDQLPKTTVQTTSDNWSISFRYCYVDVNRAWMNTTIPNLPNWYFPGAPAGFFSAGVPGKVLAQFPMLPHSFLAIRDLRISATWSDQDRATMNQALTFGPFDLRNKTVVQNEIRADGLQIALWLSTRNPALAPMADPHMP
jgi:hypothetical protein